MSDELVSADAGHEGSAAAALEPARDRAQKLVADHVAEYVVGLLELVEVDARTAKLSPRPLARSKVCVRRGERIAIWQIGQRIVMRKIGDLLVAGEQLRARHAHLLARLAETERGAPGPPPGEH